MKKIKFGKATVEGRDCLITKVEDFGDTLVVSCADAYQLHRIEINKSLLKQSLTDEKISPKYRDRITLFSASLNDGCAEDDFENRHFFASFLLAARINGKEWFHVPENKAFSIPFDDHVY